MIRTYAVGEHNTVLRSDNHSGTWLSLSTGATPESKWYDVMSDPNNPDKVVVVGRSDILGGLPNPQHIKVSTDAGATWFAPAGNWSDAITFFKEVWFVDSNVVWAVGVVGVVVLSTDGGLTFNTVSNIPSGILTPNGLYSAGIHAISDEVAVVLGSNDDIIGADACYVWKTTDGGNNWNILNGGQSLSGIDPIGVANGIKLSDDGLTIIAATGYGHCKSSDGGATFTFIPNSMERSGVHLTWFPSHGAFTLNYRHVGGTTRQITESTDDGDSFQTISGLDDNGVYHPIGETPLSRTILGAHFYQADTGYYLESIGNTCTIQHSTNGGVTGVEQHTGSPDLNAVWTGLDIFPPVFCYELTDCNGIKEPIYTQQDLSEMLGSIVTLKGEDGSEIKGECWLINLSGSECPEAEVIDLYTCYEDCEKCLPTPPPIRKPNPRPVNPGYTTGLCDSDMVEKVFCNYADHVYNKMMAKRFKIDFCCEKDETSLVIKNEKIQLKLMEGDTLVPDTCNPKCYSYSINIKTEDSAVTTYVDCFNAPQEVITNVSKVVGPDRILEFCALDTSVPTAVITDANGVETTHVLERLDDCTPEPVLCTLYNITVKNIQGLMKGIPYLNCQGFDEYIDFKGNSNKEEYNYQVCGYPNQTITPEGGIHEKDVFIVTEEGNC